MQWNCAELEGFEMSEQELYEIASERIDQRNRRWTRWAIHLATVAGTLALLIWSGDTGFADVAAGIFLGWGGVFAMHTIWLVMAESRDEDIEKEVAKLRTAMDSAYEKPKRLGISDDGELIASDDWVSEDEERSARR